MVIGGQGTVVPNWAPQFLSRKMSSELGYYANNNRVLFMNSEETLRLRRKDARLRLDLLSLNEADVVLRGDPSECCFFQRCKNDSAFRSLYV